MSTSEAHHYQTLINLVETLFFTAFNTRLVKGDDEPIYLPANEECNYHRIVFAHGFFASALHEIAHWCVAGSKRRLKVDFGYWYCPDGRNAEQQAKFEVVEIKPQALEWCFCIAAGFPFQVSVDNLSGEGGDRFAFQEKVHLQVQQYLKYGIPKRAQMFINGLHSTFKTPSLSIGQFHWKSQESKGV